MYYIMVNYKQKYLKYKMKYLQLKGGQNFSLAQKFENPTDELDKLKKLKKITWRKMQLAIQKQKDMENDLADFYKKVAKKVHPDKTVVKEFEGELRLEGKAPGVLRAYVTSINKLKLELIPDARREVEIAEEDMIRVVKKIEAVVQEKEGGERS